MTRRDPTVVIDLELSQPFRSEVDLRGYGDAKVLLRLHGRPLGFVDAPIEDARLATGPLIRRILNAHGWTLAVPLAEQAIAARRPPGTVEISALFDNPPETRVERPLVTVAVCTRDRAGDLARCLQALLALDYPSLDLLVVDNAPATNDTERLVRGGFPQVRYVLEPRPGLDWARNRAILECRGDVLAFTDDDVVVDTRWVSSLVRVFMADPQAMAVTGLVIPHELDTEAQRLFETYGGFGRGFLRRWYRAPAGRPVAPLHGGAGKFGTGANMAFRRSLFDRIGGFDPALDVGTCTNGGGDLEMFFRVLKEGHTLVYEPAAIVRHRHRRGYEHLRTQIANNGIGFYSYLVRTAGAYRDERAAVARLGAWWFRWWNLRRMGRGVLRKELIPLELIAAELVGSLRGLTRYRQARRRAAELQAAFPGEPTLLTPPPAAAPPVSRRRLPEAVRHIDLAAPLASIADATDYERLRLFVSWNDVPLGAVRVEHHGAIVGPLWQSDVIAQQLTVALLDAATRLGPGVFWANLTSSLARALAPAGLPVATRHEGRAPLPSHETVSIVIATCDRPADLTRCLESLVAQRTGRHLEIVVVDNHPQSGITMPIVEQFPGVKLVEERRPGLSYARNRGIAAASGDIIVTTDDDVIAPPEWIERLVAPFRQTGVMVVSGNVLPLELETDAQRLFEAYGGLGRGFSPFIVDHEWFRRGRRSVRTWELGCTANAAFRAGIFSDPEIGLLDEALGAGTPTGCSEDTYVFYRVLKAGYAIAYEPDAYVWHRHRQTMKALRKQIYSYSKGHVAYQLTTWMRDGDLRGLVRVGYELPRTYLRRAWHRLRGYSDYPLAFIGLEILGNLAGPVALWQSRRRVRRLGPSDPLLARPVPAGASGTDEKAA